MILLDMRATIASLHAKVPRGVSSGSARGSRVETSGAPVFFPEDWPSIVEFPLDIHLKFIIPNGR
jgi:hypothetical protein